MVVTLSLGEFNLTWMLHTPMTKTLPIGLADAYASMLLEVASAMPYRRVHLACSLSANICIATSSGIIMTKKINAGNVVTHHIPIGDFDGPHPFFGSDGKLL